MNSMHSPDMTNPDRRAVPVEITLNGRKVAYAYRQTVEDYLGRQFPLGSIRWVSGLDHDAMLALNRDVPGVPIAGLVKGITSLLACPLGSRS